VTPAPMLLAAMLAAATPPAKAPAPKVEDWQTFIDRRDGWCREYRAAPSDKKRAAVFKKYSKAVKDRMYGSATLPAVVTGIEETHGGVNLILRVSTARGECSNDDVWSADSPYHVEKGSAVFDAVRGLREGQAVTVSIARIRPWHSELQPGDSLCNGRWLVQFVGVAPTAPPAARP
jgi:hypothetical protein